MHLLIVEDDVDTAQFFEAILRRIDGMTLTFVHDPHRHLDAALDGGPFDAAIVDYMLPGTNGGQVIDRIVDRWPETRIVLCSAIADHMPADVKARAHRIVAKPVRYETLVQELLGD